MKKISLVATGLMIFSLIFNGLPVLAATDDFTANSNITVSNVTIGDTTVDVTIMNNSTAQSWSYDGGTFTVTNPGNFMVGCSSSTVGVINVSLNDALVECAVNSTAGTSYVTIPTTAGTYTISPSTAAACSTSLCTALENTATYNAYPTCGAASCTAGHRLNGSGGSATCVIAASSPLASPSSGGGGGSVSLQPSQTIYAGNITGNGLNFFMYLGSKVNFNIQVSTTGAIESHNATIDKLDLINKKITVIFNSDPITMELTIGDVKTVDLTGDGKGDIVVTFNDLTVNKIDLTIKPYVMAVQTERAGELVKLACGNNAGTNDPCKAVYYIGHNGKRYIFPNDKVYNSWYKDFSTVKSISAEDLARYQIGGNITYRPGIRMIKIQTDPRVYAVAKNGVLRWLKSEEIAKDLYGAEWNKLIDDVADTFFINYKRGADVGASAGYDKMFAQNSSPDISTDKGLQ